jgi:hypothetical protein
MRYFNTQITTLNSTVRWRSAGDLACDSSAVGCHPISAEGKPAFVMDVRIIYIYIYVY